MDIPLAHGAVPPTIAGLPSWGGERSTGRARAPFAQDLLQSPVNDDPLDPKCQASDV